MKYDKISRFTDILEEPIDRVLLPIRGYETKPLVSLSDALKPVYECFDNIEAYISVALYNCRNPIDGLTKQESASIHLYTMEFDDEFSLYIRLNQSLRSENRDQLKPWFSYLKLFLTALNKLPSENKIIWRIVPNIDLTSKYKKGKKFIWWGISSCTTNIQLLESNLSLDEHGLRTLFCIKSINGKSISNHSYYENKEKEIILMPASYFEVIGQLNPSPGLFVILLNEILLPVQLIKPPFIKSLNRKHSFSINKFNLIFQTTSNISSKEILSKSNIQWKQYGITIAGGNNYGCNLNQLAVPYSLFIDNDQNIYIADTSNHRIIQWKLNMFNGEIIAGENGQGNQINQLNYPTDLFIDKENNSLIICDSENRRIVKWSYQNNTTNREILISNINCRGITMDKDGSIYVSDLEMNQIKRWKKGEKEGTIVAGGNGQGEHFNQFSWPTYIYIDDDYSLYVSDWGNHRVMKWIKDAKEGIIVAGGNGQGNNLTQLSYPQGIIVNQFGQIYVADTGNNRIMSWNNQSKEGIIVVGGNGQGEQSNQLNHPAGLSFDRQGNLYVVDTENHRIQKFEIDFKNDLSSETINVQPTLVFNSDIIGLSLKPSEYYILPSQQNTINSISIRLKPISKNISNILIACLGINSSLISSKLSYVMELFDDECVCIAQLLSMNNKRVYFIVSNLFGDYIIPLIYQHRCIEWIYIYSSDDNQINLKQKSNFQKIRGYWTDYETLLTAVNDDIQSILSEVQLWSNEKLILNYHTQTLIDSPKDSIVALDMVDIGKYSNWYEQLHIVILHCNNYILFNMNSQYFNLHEFFDIVECVKYLETMNVESIFLIISGVVSNIIRDLKSILMLKTIYALYIFVQSNDEQKLDETLLSYKNIGKLFDNLQYLLICLTADIKFYLKQSLYIPVLSVCTSFNNIRIKNNIELTENQKNFMAFQLFVNIAQHAPSSIFHNENLYDRCLISTKNESNGENVLKILESEKDKIFNWFIDVPFLSGIINTFLKEEFPKNLLDIQQILRTIDQRLNELPSINCSSVVYQTQFLREKDFKIIKANINGLIAFHKYIIGTKDLLTARTIARQAVDRGLLIIILQIEIPARANVIELDNNRLIFRFVSIFRIQSINIAVDGVWYAQLKYAQSDFQLIEQRFHIQIGERLTWLTFGNYLCFLNYFDQAKSYYQYLINVLPKDHRALPSIYNNMALIFTEMNDLEQALIYYDLAETLINIISSNRDNTQENIYFKTLSHSDETLMTIDYCKLYDRMAEIHFNQSNPNEALKYYRKALELSTNPLTHVYFEEKIKNILSSK